MKTRGNGDPDANQQVRVHRFSFISACRAHAVDRIRGLAEAMDAGPFEVTVSYPRTTPAASYCLVLVEHEGGPDVFRSVTPISLAYPDRVFPAILADIMSTAKNDCKVNVN